MMVVFGGSERYPNNWKNLLKETRFELVSIRRIRSIISWIKSYHSIFYLNKKIFYENSKTHILVTTIDYHGNASLQFMDFLACGCHVSDTRRKNLFDASIKTDIVIDVMNCIRIG